MEILFKHVDLFYITINPKDKKIEPLRQSIWAFYKIFIF